MLYLISLLLFGLFIVAAKQIHALLAYVQNAKQFIDSSKRMAQLENDLKTSQQLYQSHISTIETLQKQMEGVSSDRQTNAVQSNAANADTVSRIKSLEDKEKLNQERLLILEDILCRNQRKITDVQAISKINDIQETAKAMELTMTGLKEAMIDLQEKQTNYKIMMSSINRIKKSIQGFESRLVRIETKNEQQQQAAKEEESPVESSIVEINHRKIKTMDTDYMESRISLLEEAVFGSELFEFNSKLVAQMRNMTDRIKTLEIKIKFMERKKVVDSQKTEYSSPHQKVDNLSIRFKALKKHVDSNRVDCSINNGITELQSVNDAKDDSAYNSSFRGIS